VNGTSQCSAKVSGSGGYSSVVNWSASDGTISTAGLFTASSVAGTISVTARSTQDPTKLGTASISVTSPPSAVATVEAVCNPSVVAPGASSQCVATVQGTGSFNSAVTWSASEGSINATGLFAAPLSSATVTIVATSVQDKTRSGSVTVTVESSSPQPVHSKHVVVVMEENQSFSTVVRNTNDWPNLNALIANGSLPANYYANTHPSIGNYFMLTTGQILTNNDSNTTVWNVDNIARRMLAEGVSFRVYAEGIPRGYIGGNTGSYLVRHNPFALLSDVAGDPQVANRCIWPFAQFAVDVADGTLPQFSYVVPDVNDDAHNGTPKDADRWLQSNIIIPLSSYAPFQPGGDGVLIVGFDEAADSDSTYGGGHIAPVLWGPNVKIGFTQVSGTVFQHQSMLRTLMEMLQLSNPPGAAAGAPSMSEFFKQK
jgi:phosphoesterase family protein